MTMTDLIARIEAHLQTDDAEQRWLDSDNLLEEAQAEIEQLRSLVDQCNHHETSLEEAQVEIEELYAQNQHWNDKLGDAHAEIERLTACLRWEQNWLERVGTHSDGCWQWGPGHYLCAVRHIEEAKS